MVLSVKEMSEKLRPTCNLIKTHLRPNNYLVGLEVCGCEKSECPNCGHINKSYWNDCCGRGREEDEEKDEEFCECTTFYCTICHLYRGTEIPDNLPTCRGFSKYDRWDKLIGYSNTQTLEELELESTPEHPKG